MIVKNKFRFTQIRTAIYIAVLVIINLFFVNISFVIGSSMNDTLSENQIVLVLKAHNELIQKDIVITNKNNPYKVNMIKRIIAVEKQHLIINDNSVSVDGVIILEPYLNLSHPVIYSNNIDIVVPDGMVFLMGDNRNYSKDSRDIGCIYTKDIIGKVILW